MLRVRAYPGVRTPPEEVEPERIREVLDGGTPLVWVDAQSPTTAEIDLVRGELGIHDLAAEDLHHARQRVKLDPYEDHFLLVAYELLIEGEDLITREVDILVGDRWVLTARQGTDHPAEPFTADSVRRFEFVRHTATGADEGFLLHAVLDTLVDHYLDTIDVMRGHLDVIERSVFEGDGGGGMDIQRDVYSLRRSLVSFMRLAAPLGDALEGLVRREVGHLDRAAVVHLQDVHDHVVRAVEDARAQLELLDGALQAHLGLASQRLNVAMERMTSWGAILLVSTLVAGIYGMNFRHMPELDWVLGYPLALGMMVASGVALYVMFKRRGWL